MKYFHEIFSWNISGQTFRDILHAHGMSTASGGRSAVDLLRVHTRLIYVATRRQCLCHTGQQDLTRVICWSRGEESPPHVVETQ